MQNIKKLNKQLAYRQQPKAVKKVQNNKVYNTHSVFDQKQLDMLNTMASRLEV